MRLWTFLAVWIVWGVGCTTSPQAGGQLPAAIASAPKKDLCQELRQSLPVFTPPLQLPAQQSADPFALEVQDWLREKLASGGVYSPLGRWRHENGAELWIVERIAQEGLFYYAILVDSVCSLLDTAQWGRQVVQTDRLEQASFRLDREGRCYITEEVHVTSFVGEQPQSTVTRQTRLYAVDWAAGKLRPL